MTARLRSAALRLLLLELLESLAQLMHRDRFLLGRQDDLARENDRHRTGRRLQEVVHRAAEARLDVFDRRREVGADLRGAPDAERLDGVADETAGLDEPGARSALHPRLVGDLLGRLGVGARRARPVI